MREGWLRFNHRWQLSNYAEGGSYRWRVPFMVMLLVIFLGEMAAAPGRSLLPVYAEAQLGRPPQFTSALLSVQLLFGAIAAFTGGGLVDALGHKGVMVLGASGLLLIGTVFLTGSPLALVLLWIYTGFALGVYHIGRQTYIMAIVPGRYLGMATALGFTGLTLGSALGNLLAAPVVDRYGFSTLGIAATLLSVAVFLVVALAIPAARTNRGCPGSFQSFAGYNSVVRRPGVRLIAVMRFFATSYWAAATLLIPLLIYRAARVPSAAAYYVTASFLFASVCQLLAGRLLDRFGCRTPVALLTAMLGGISVVTAAFTSSLLGLCVCGILGAGIAWALATATPSVITGVAPQEEHGRTLGVTQVATSAGMLMGTQVGGWLVDANAGLPFLLIGLANLLMVASAAALSRCLNSNLSCSLPDTAKG
ncbi:MAG: MFS transporter [Anaerolineae bacterium]